MKVSAILGVVSTGVAITGAGLVVIWLLWCLVRHFHKQPVGLRLAFPSDTRQRHRLLMIIILALLTLAITWPILHHPYFHLYLWPNEEVQMYVDNRDKEFLLRAFRSPIVTQSVKKQVLGGLMILLDRCGSKIYLSNEEIDMLESKYPEVRFYFAFFYVPFVNGKPNSRLVSIILNQNAKDGDRLAAFMQLCEPRELSGEQVEQIEDLWKKIDSEKVRLRTMKFVVKNKQCGMVSTNLFPSIAGTTEEELSALTTKMPRL